MAVHELFAYLRAKDAEKMIAFCKRAFGATEKFRLVEPSGRIGHAELMPGHAVLMLPDEFPEYDSYAPEADARARSSSIFTWTTPMQRSSKPSVPGRASCVRLRISSTVSDPALCVIRSDTTG